MAENRFFRGHKRRGSYDLFSSYSHYLPGIGGMLVLLAMFLIGALLGNLINSSIAALLGRELALKYGTLISYPVMFIPALLYASVRSRLNEHAGAGVPLDNNEGLKGKTALYIFTCVFATIATAYIVEPAMTLLPPMPQWLKTQMDLITKNMPLWASLISVSVFAPLFEEWLCRGLVLRGLLGRMKPVWAITVSALFFAVLHANPWQAIPAFILGALFGYVYYRTGSLKLTMLMHCANNTLSVFLSKIPQFQDAETFMDVLSPWAYWSVYAACVVTVCCALVVFSKKRASEKETETTR